RVFRTSAAFTSRADDRSEFVFEPANMRESSRSSQVPVPNWTTTATAMLSPKKPEKMPQSLGSTCRAMRIAAHEVATIVSAWDATSSALSANQRRIHDGSGGAKRCTTDVILIALPPAR